MSEKTSSGEALSGVIDGVSRRRSFCYFVQFFCLNLLFLYKTEDFCGEKKKKRIVVLECAIRSWSEPGLF